MATVPLVTGGAVAGFVAHMRNRDGAVSDRRSLSVQWQIMWS